MTCLKCNDERIIWTHETLGQLTCQPCPACNKNGESVRQEQAKLDREIEQLKREIAVRERIAVNG